MGKIVIYAKFLLEKINVEVAKKFFEKDATVLVLMLLTFCQFIPLEHEIYQEIIPLVITITSKDAEDMMNMGKSFLFRILNRFIKKKIRIQRVQNTPVKRNYDEFRTYRHIGGKTEGNGEPPANLITNKSDNYYYPLRVLQYLNRAPLDSNMPNEALLMEKIST